jgi:hypothetical protein
MTHSVIHPLDSHIAGACRIQKRVGVRILKASWNPNLNLHDAAVSLPSSSVDTHS